MEPKTVAEWMGIWGGVLATLHAVASLGKWLWSLRRPIHVRVTHKVTLIEGAVPPVLNDIYFITITNRGNFALTCNSVYMQWKGVEQATTGLAVNTQVLPGDSLPLRMPVPPIPPAARVRASVVMASGDEYQSRWLKTRPNWFRSADKGSASAA